MYGVISYFNVRKPTPSELESGRYERLELTSDEPWDRLSPNFGEREAKAQSVYDSFPARNSSVLEEGWAKRPLSGKMQQQHGEWLIAALCMSTIQNELPLEGCDDSFICSATKFQDVQRDFMSDRLVSAVQVAATNSEVD